MRKIFYNQLLFTHRGISGPAVLQISNYWQPTESVEIDLLPNHNVEEEINQAKQSSPKQMLKTILVRLLPKKLVELWIEQGIVQDEVIANISKVRVKIWWILFITGNLLQMAQRAIVRLKSQWAEWILK